VPADVEPVAAVFDGLRQAPNTRVGLEHHDRYALPGQFEGGSKTCGTGPNDDNRIWSGFGTVHARQPASAQVEGDLERDREPPLL